jgi:integrase
MAKPKAPAVIEDKVSAMAKKIATEAPTLANLSESALMDVARVVVGQRLTRDLDRRATLAKINYEAEKQAFLAQVGHSDSPHTARAYTAALVRLERFCARSGLPVLDLSPLDADTWIYDLTRSRRSPAAVRLDVAAVSSLYSFLERRYSGIHNPFRGTKARPRQKPVRELQIPTEIEVKTIIDALEGIPRAAVAIMAYRGLRVGALPGLSIRGATFRAVSKGKTISGHFSDQVFDYIKTSGLSPTKPFFGRSEAQIADAIRYKTKILNRELKVLAPYSVHDFRHFYAVQEYKRYPDIYRISVLLGHSSINVTERYLKSLRIIE